MLDGGGGGIVAGGGGIKLDGGGGGITIGGGGGVWRVGSSPGGGARPGGGNGAPNKASRGIDFPTGGRSVLPAGAVL